MELLLSADEVIPFRIDAADANGVIRADRPITDLMNKESRQLWESSGDQDYLRVFFVIRSTDREFDTLVRQINANGELRVEVEPSYNPVQNWGGMTVSGRKADLENFAQQGFVFDTFQIEK